METKRTNVIKKTKEEWEDRKESLGFSRAEIIPEDLQAEIGEFLIELKAAQVLLGVLKDLQTDSSALDKWQHGLFEHQHSIGQRIKLILEEKDIKKQKHVFLSIITKNFADCSIRIKDLLHLLEQEYKNTNEYKNLQKISTILEKFVFDLKQPNPQNIEQVISDFKNYLSDAIKVS